MTSRRLLSLLLPLLSLAAGAAEAPLLFRNATVIAMDTAGALERHDLLVKDGKIARLVPTGSIDFKDARIVDASGKFLLPGSPRCTPTYRGRRPRAMRRTC